MHIGKNNPKFDYVLNDIRLKKTAETAHQQCY
jgi:hypothetical protein